MKKLISLFLFISITGCSSTREQSTPPPPPPAGYDGFFCGTDPGCAAVYLLVYGTAAVVKLIQNTKFTSPESESVEGGIVINCYIQSPDRSYLSPCSQFTVDMIEKKTNKKRNYTFTGDRNDIGFVEGKNKISIRLSECGLIQQADDVKSGDIIRLEFPASCKLAKTN